MKKWLLLVAILPGLLIAFIDSRPNWDDTGITAGMVFLTSMLFGVLFPDRAWLSALAVGIWIPLFGIVRHQNYGSILALAIAFLAAYAGAFLRKVTSRTNRTSL